MFTVVVPAFWVLNIDVGPGRRFGKLFLDRLNEHSTHQLGRTSQTIERCLKDIGIMDRQDDPGAVGPQQPTQSIPGLEEDQPGGPLHGRIPQTRSSWSLAAPSADRNRRRPTMWA